MWISVIICTYAPDPANFNRVLAGLQVQTLPQFYWELIIVDNNSPIPVAGSVNEKMFPQLKLIKEERSGLTFARLAGFRACRKGSLIVFLDDDNVAAPDYLQKAWDFHQDFPKVGCAGGRALPAYEMEPPKWFAETGLDLGCRDLGDQLFISNHAANKYRVSTYPSFAPIGTGMVITHAAFAAYAATIDEPKLSLGRKGKALTSGEDNDIILSVIEAGFELAYSPELLITHLIPSRRLAFAYLCELAYQSNRSWMKVLFLHGINPHSPVAAWTVGPRAVRAWFRMSAWRSKLNYIKWRGACGVFKGLSECY